MLVYNSERGLASTIVCPEKLLTGLDCIMLYNVCCDGNHCGSSKCKGPVVGAGPAHWRNKGRSVAGAEHVRGRLEERKQEGVGGKWIGKDLTGPCVLL